MDVFDFLEQPCEYHIQVWHFGTTQGVDGLPGTWTSISEAVQALRAHTKLDLVFTEGSENMDTLASRMYEERAEVAIVCRAGWPDVVAWASLGGIKPLVTA